MKLLEHWDSYSTSKGQVSSFQHWLLNVLKSDIRISAAMCCILNGCQAHSPTLCSLILPTASTSFYRWDVEQREVQSSDQVPTASNSRSQDSNPQSLASAKLFLTTMAGLWEYLLNYCLEELGSSIIRILWIIKHQNHKILEEEIFRSFFPKQHSLCPHFPSLLFLQPPPWFLSWLTYLYS